MKTWGPCRTSVPQQPRPSVRHSAFGAKLLACHGRAGRCIVPRRCVPWSAAATRGINGAATTDAGLCGADCGCGARRPSGSRASGGRPATAGPCPPKRSYPNCDGRARHPEHGRHARHAQPPVLRAARHERPRLRHVPSTGRRHVAVGRQRSASAGRPPAARTRCSRPSTAVNCPAPAGRRSGRRIRCCSTRGLVRVALPWPPRDAAGARVARRVHARGRARSDAAATRTPRYGLNSATADGVRLPPSAARWRTRST